MTITDFDEIIPPTDQTEARAEHLEKLRELIGNVYPNKFDRSSLSGGEDTITAILDHGPVADIAREMADVRSKLAERERPPVEVKDALNERLRALGNVRIAGRLTTPPRGNFVHLTDGMNKLQIYCKKGQFVVGTQAASLRAAEGDDTRRRDAGATTLNAEDSWTVWQLIDHGDFIGVEGYLFVTNTGEVSVHVEKLQFLAKAMVPMPDKMHGIEDPEIKQRQRYVDLIGSSLQVRSEPPASAGGQVGEGETPELTTREVFERRAKIISSMRHFLEDHGYVEVETPMLTPKATGAAARPFKTHHNALDIDLYARIAPELYLKRLLVGGFEKVFELNRNFRNEGISYKHNPEFTMLEFYCAYMDVNGMMDFCEKLLTEAVKGALGRDDDEDLSILYENRTINFNRFPRLSMKAAILRVLKTFFSSLDESWLDDPNILPALADVSREFAERANHLMRPPNGSDAYLVSTLEIQHFQKLGWQFLPGQYNRFYEEEGYADKLLARRLETEHGRSTINPGAALALIFENVAERSLIDPTFIIDYPKSISPLSKASPENPQVAERFELFINGMEVANGFSELNDPREQYERFVDQMAERERGDEEAMVLDEDYIRALSYGMPPAAGIGVGVDRLVMLLTNRHSIRDVILFPHMRPERKDVNAEDAAGTGEED